MIIYNYYYVKRGFTMNHSQSYIIIEKILNKWKRSCPNWNSVVSENIFLGKTPFLFPCPDYSIVDVQNNHSIAIEFKSIKEGKSGILKSLGQAICYLSTYSIVYLVLPNKIEHFDVKEYILKIFNTTKINEHHAIGLITYNPSTQSIDYLHEININLNLNQISTTTFNSSYWAKFRDSYPHTIWTLLDIANNNQTLLNRKIKIWTSFYNNFLLPINDSFWTNNDPLENWFEFSKSYNWDLNSKQIIGQKIVSNLIRDVSENNQSLLDAKNYLKNKYFLSENSDRPFNQLMKNNFNFMNHLNLFDDNYHLTEHGYLLHKIGKLYGWDSILFKKEFAKILLTKGNHLDLIIDINNIQIDRISYYNMQNIKFSKDKLLLDIENTLSSQGKIKTNTSRVTTHSRKFLNSELQLWFKLGIIIKQNNSFFHPNLGLLFNWKEIVSFIND